MGLLEGQWIGLQEQSSGVWVKGLRGGLRAGVRGWAQSGRRSEGLLEGLEELAGSGAARLFEVRVV